MKKIIAILLSAILLLGALAGCSDTKSTTDISGDESSIQNGSTGGSGASDGSAAASTVSDNPVEDLVLYRTSELENFNIFYCFSTSGFSVMGKCIDPLITMDKYGNLIPCLATEWGTDDNGKTWTFKLRDDAVWVDSEGNYKADVVAEDWVTGLEWVLNFWESEGRNASFVTTTVEGALEYYEYTSSLEKEAARNVDYDLFKEMVGIETPDEHTVVYHCVDEIVYFDTLATYCSLYPVSRGQIEELGVEGYYGIQGTDLWSCGPYVVSYFVADNETILTPNPLWWDTESTRYNSVTYKIIESDDSAFLMYQSGEIDQVTLTESTIRTIADNESNEFHDYLINKHTATYAGRLTFNYAKNLEDGTPDVNWNTAAGNINFRKCFYYNVDWTDYLSRINVLDPLSCQGYSIIGPGLVSIDGKDYATYVNEALGLDSTNTEEYDRYDAELGEQFKQTAIDELTAQGVTFPIELDYYIASGNQTQLDTANVFKACVEEYLGADFVTVQIKTYITNMRTEVQTPSLNSIQISTWAADYGDPIAVLDLACNDKPSGIFASNAHIFDSTNEDVLALFDEYTALVRAADTIHDDLQARYQAFADAEVFLIDNVLFLPLYQTSYVQLSKVNDYDKAVAGYGIQEFRGINERSNAEGYTTEEWEALKAEYEAGRK